MLRSSFKYTALLASAMLLLSAGNAAVASERLGIAAIVNDDAVTFSEVRARMQLYLTDAEPGKEISEESKRRLQAQVLNKLIDEKLQMQEATTMGVLIPEEQVAGGFANVARQNGLSIEDFRKKLAGGGIDVGTLYDQIRADLAWSQVVRRKLRPSVNISEGEIDNELTTLEHSRGKKEFLVAEIFLPVTSDETAPTVKDRAENISKQIVAGARFSQLAYQFSQAPGAATGGDLGWLQEGRIDPALERALQTMKTGQLSVPIRSGKGYHILLLRDMRQVGKNLATSVASAVVHLKRVVVPVAIDDPMPVVAAKTVRAETLRGEIKSCDDMAIKAAEFETEGGGDLGKMALADLDETLRNAVSLLKAGELTAPIRTPAGFAVVMVCSRDDIRVEQAAAETGGEGSREEIANKLGMQRLQQMQDHYLRDLRATAYIDRRI